jgi:hypothetical protein
MNQILKISLAILGGIEAVFSISLPILVSLIWIRITNDLGWSSYLLLTAGIFASMFRAIKIGFSGFFK